MRRHFLIVLFLWILLTAIGEVAALQIDIYPVAASEEAEHIDQAMRQLIIMGVPVFMFVLAVVAFSLWRFRVPEQPEEEGPPIFGHPTFWTAWLGVTSALAVAVFLTPGLTGLNYLRSRPSEDLVVRVEAAQWHWHISYPEYDLEIKSNPSGFEHMDGMPALGLPAGQHIKFELTSVDVIHSFWIPAFRMKVDAVPGQVTTLRVTPNRTGDFAEDFNYRVQCAELCGTGHPRMSMPVAVMERTAFEEWVATQKQEQMMGGMQMGGSGDEHTQENDHNAGDEDH